eukprot:scaffold154822_cov51-Attheya_sp.AAC.2
MNSKKTAKDVHFVFAGSQVIQGTEIEAFRVLVFNELFHLCHEFVALLRGVRVHGKGAPLAHQVLGGSHAGSHVVGESELLLHDVERGLGGAGALALLVPQQVRSLGPKLHLQRIALVKKGCRQLVVLKVFLRVVASNVVNALLQRVGRQWVHRAPRLLHPRRDGSVALGTPPPRPERNSRR